MGVSGSGKTTVGRLLAASLHVPFEEGDELHPPANIAKMAAGLPLTDADRAPWLARVAAWIRGRVDVGGGGVIACSALKRSYRDELRAVEPAWREAGHVEFVYLAATHRQLVPRVAARPGHFMPASLLDSQLAELEPPAPDEPAVTVHAAPDPGIQVAAVIARLDLR